MAIMKKLDRFAKARFRRLKKNIKEFAVSRQIETLHQIRVEIKKIKSVLLGIGFSSGRFKSHKAFLPLREIFRRAGEIREPVLIGELLAKYNLSGGGKGLQGDPARIEEFVANVPRYLTVVGKRKDKVLAALKAVKENDVKMFIRQLRREIRLELYPEVSVQNLHKTRKMIKELLYLAAPLDLLKRREGKFLEETERLIGDRQDKLLVLEQAKKGVHNDSLMSSLNHSCGLDAARLKRSVTAFYA